MPYTFKPAFKITNEQRLKLADMLASLFPDYKIVFVNGYFVFMQGENMEAWRNRESIHWFQLCLTWLPEQLFKRLSPEDDEEEYESWYGEYLELVLQKNQHPIDILIEKYKWQ